MAGVSLDPASTLIILLSPEVGDGVGDPDDRPAEGRPLVDSITASRLSNLKELRPPSAGRTEIRILFVFDPWRSAVLLVAGDKSGQWTRWYREAIPEAEQLYDTYLKERQEENR
ncbi:type II toxin-antitoxin system RelE/ParE family toxin [Micromonospora aurantiaca (nom. illeg.)]|uniref:type II toxin-antitoxin system RelE/ParE family toxin n=1 Tax=Micromonospora aurantiaca (nom. illeg.) TaxID=47850 RepID=UPI000B84D9CC|nr:type II toxin-antitoxin system RelE/ParE family toxin [Micromonospora aurantiaca]